MAQRIGLALAEQRAADNIRDQAEAERSRMVGMRRAGERALEIQRIATRISKMKGRFRARGIGLVVGCAHDYSILISALKHLESVGVAKKTDGEGNETRNGPYWFIGGAS